MLSRGFKAAKCKTALNLGKSRVKLMKNKKDIQLRQLRREVAQLLQNSQDQTARIRVEHVVREEKTLAAYEMIEIYCELIVARLPIIESQKNCPLDLKEAITSLIFAAPRCGDIPELQDVRKHFTAKYGKDFAAAAIELHPACGVSRLIVEKLSVKAPDGPTKVKILKGIAEEHNIQWEPNWFKDEDLVSSGDTPKKLHVDNSTIQMEPLNIQIADDLEEMHAHSTTKLQNSSQRHSRTNVEDIPPSPTLRPDFRPSGNVSEAMPISQSSGKAENSFPAEGRKWNREFKDAAEAAQAAAESAEQASMAARAAAELSIRDSHRRGLSSLHGESEGEQRNPINRSMNQRGSNVERHQRNPNEQCDISEGHDVRRNSNVKQQGYEESESTFYRVNDDGSRRLKDHASNPSNSKGHSNWSNSSNNQEYETEPDENPFHQGTAESQNHDSKIYSQPGGFEDEYETFSDLNYRSDEIDSDSSFGASGQVISKVENLHAKTTYLSKSNSINDEPISGDHGKRQIFKESGEENDRFSSGNVVFVGSGERHDGFDTNEKLGHNVANAVFDDSGSDDDECILAPAENYNSPSGKLSPRHPGFEPDLSDSFRNSSIYSKLIEPLPITFDDYDGLSPKSEKKWPTESTEPEWDAQVTTGSTGQSFGEKGTDGSSFSNKLVDENQNLNVGSHDEGKGFDSPRSYRLFLESKYRPEFDSGNYSEGGMGLNLGSLPGGRRNRLGHNSSYKRDGFIDSEESSPSYKFQGPSDQVGEDFHVEDNSYSRPVPDDVHETHAKDPTSYYKFDDEDEEDVPVPVMRKKLQNAGISRRTKGSATKTGRISSSSNATQDSPKRQVETTDSSSRIIGQSSWNNNATSGISPGIKASKNENSHSPVHVEKPETQSSEIQKAPSRENSGKKLSHVHPKLPDFETFTAHLQSLRTNRQ